MKIHRLLRAAGLLALVVASAMAAAPAVRPNIVFIMADDLGWADVAFHGGTAPTPHLDQLVREGVHLTQHYVAPVCSPTRTALMTGRYWSRFGVTTPDSSHRLLPWDTVTVARALKSAGYNTCLAGKWHLGPLPEFGPNRFGFDHGYGSLAGGVGPWDHRYKEGPFSFTWHRDGKLIEEKGHVTDLIAKEAIDWLGQQSKTTPFFLYVPFTAVHLPLKEPAEWVQRVPAAISGEVPRHYAASIMHLDDAVGQIVAALEKNGQRQRTLLVFTSDNGGSTSENADQLYPRDDYPAGKIPGNNRPLRGNKGDLHEGGIRVPTVVNWPGVLATREESAPCHVADWMPTFCGLAGFTPKQDLKWDGVNIWPVIAGQTPAATRTLYWAGTGFRSQALREGNWKLIVFSRPDGAQLFDLSRDPNEKEDLAAKMPGRVADMKKRLKEVARVDRDAEVPK